MGGNSTGAEDEKKHLLEDHPPKPRKGGHITILIILVNDACERAASIGLAPNMIFYLMNEYHLEAAPASIILSVWSALSSGLAIVGAFLADSYLGRFRVIALGSISSLCGTILIWLTAMIPQLRPPACEQSSNGCNPPGTAQLFVLLCSYVLISTGAGCIRPCSMAFGIDQLNEERNPNSQRAVERYINWYNGCIALAAVFTLTIIVYIQDNTSWKVGFAVSAIFMAFSAPVFLLASSLYVKVRAGRSVFTGFFQVVVAAWKNKRIGLPSDNHTFGSRYYQGDRTTVLAPTDNLRYLNKACIIRNPERDINPDGSCSDPWSLCTVEQVEALKNVLRVFPIWSTSIIVNATTPGSFTTLQAKTMYRHITPSFEIPAASAAVVCIATCLLCACIYEGVIIPLIKQCTGENRGISAKTRMALGLMCTFIAMVVSAVVEIARRNVATEQGAVDDIEASLDISFMWLIPQLVLNGLGTFFFGNGLIEYLYTQFSKKMGSIAMALSILSVSAGGLFTSLVVDVVDSVTGGGGGKISWLASNINKGHLDYYYWLLGLLSLINLVYFYVCWWQFGTNSDETTSGNLSNNAVEGEGSY